jgi:hypothetical protein
VAIALATLALMLATEPQLAIVWDEGCTLGREARVRGWIRLLIDPSREATCWDVPELGLVPGDRVKDRPDIRGIASRSDLFRPDVFAWFWPFAREEPHGHPALYAQVGLLGDLVAPRWDVVRRARLGPMLVFSSAAGAIFVALARRGGWIAGAAGAAAWVFHPHLFALGHYAHYDGLLSALWVGSILAFDRAIEPESRLRWAWMIGFGLLAGCAAATKFTGWLLPVPFLAWVVLARERRAAWALTAGGLVAALSVYVFNPPFWFHPVEGVQRFLASNLGRGQTIPLPVYFLGKVVRTPLQSLPWYNTLLWTIAATPVGILGLGILGACWTVRRGGFVHPTWGALPSLGLVHWVFLLVLRALPHTPGHDGVRLFLPAFGCLALLAGPAAARLLTWRAGLGRGLVGVAIAEAAVGLASIMPVPLSYYSPLVGGLPGAARLGLEPTYYWDALDSKTLAWLNRHTQPGAAVRFGMFARTLGYLHSRGTLRPEPVRPDSERPASWYVLQNRPGMFGANDRWLIEHERPAYVRSRFGVPLVLVYPDASLRRCAAALTEEKPSR